jgi:uncharacterized protein YukE
MRRTDEPPAIWTDFSGYPHEELIRALATANPNEVLAAADAWASVAEALHERAQDTADRTATMESSWTGAAADRYRLMMHDLLHGIRRVATAAAEIRDLTHTAREALYAAWTSMPAVSGEAARRQAVLIMAKLAERYLVLTAELNEMLSQLLPGAADPANGRPAGSVPSAELVFGSPVEAGAGAGAGAGVGGQQPLFGRMLPAGLAAAALLGRPFVPSLLAPRRPADPTAAAGKGTDTDPEPPDAGEKGSADAALGAIGGGGGIGGGGIGGGGAGGGGALPHLGGLGDGGRLPPLPDVADTGAVDREPGGVPAATGGGAGGGGQRAVPPMMPMMPMGMMGAGDGGGRRLPPWLVETQDVWGEATVVTPSVIGEDPAAGGW